jgi:hypothetical protein
MEGPHDVTVTDIAGLTAEQFIPEFRKLLLAECQNLGVRPSRITIAESPTIADGGIDAEVEAIPADKPSFLVSGPLAFQFKAVSNFSPTNETQILNELFPPIGKGKSKTRSPLKPYVAECIGKGGTYILICSKQDLTAQARTDAEAVVKRVLSYGRVEVWGANHIASYYANHPELALELKGTNSDPSVSHSQWAEEADMNISFVSNEMQDKIISSTRTFLSEKVNAHLRIAGDPGVGKTRAVLEATRDEQFKDKVRYYHNPDDFRESELARLILRGPTKSGIFVIDECPDDDASEIIRRYPSVGNRVKLISINPDSSIRAERLGRLTDSDIKRILEAYPSLSPEIVARLTPFCEGSPRAANLLAQNITANPEGDPFGEDGTPWRRFLYGRNQFDDPVIKKYEDILYFVAMFKKIGARGHYADEAEQIRKLYNSHRDTATQKDFSDALDFFKRTKVFQGQLTFYISPKALHLWLWKTWWETKTTTFRVIDFVNDLNENDALVGNFYEMFAYASTSSIAKDIAARLIRKGGPLHDTFLNSEQTTRFFLTLSKAAPEEALTLLEQRIGTASKQELLDFDKGRQNIVWALEWIAQWNRYFERAARLLVRLAEAETASNSNNASGVFADLFSGYGQVGSTEAPPALRISLLKNLLLEANPDIRSLAINAINRGLEVDHLTKMVNPPASPFEKEPDFWMPKTWQELWDYLEALWDMLYTQYGKGTPQEDALILEAISNRLGSMSRIRTKGEKIFGNVKALFERSHSMKIFESMAHIVRYDKDRVDPALITAYQEYLEEKTNADFDSKFERYVVRGIESRPYNYGEFNADDMLAEVNENVESLTKEAIENPQALLKVFPKLFERDTRHAHLLGKLLADLDSTGYWYSVVLSFLAKNHDGDMSFANTFLSQQVRNGQLDWERLRTDFSAIAYEDILVSIAARIGISDDIAKFLLDELKAGRISMKSLFSFSWGTEIRTLSPGHFAEWIDYLLSDAGGEEGLSIAISITSKYYLNRSEDSVAPKDLLLKILTHPKSSRLTRRNMNDYEWDLLIKHLLKRYPDDVSPFISFFFSQYGKEKSFFDMYSHYAGTVAHRLISQFPVESWRIISQYLEAPTEWRNVWSLQNLLKGSMSDNKDSNGSLIDIPVENIFRWIDEDPEPRLELIGHTLPAGFGDKHWQFVRAFLIKYPHSDNIRRGFLSSFTTGSWMGPTSNFYRKKLDLLREKLEAESEASIRTWIQEFISDLEKAIELARGREERGEF